MFEKSPANVTVKAQNAIRLECKSQAPVVFPSVRDWRKDDQPISEADIKSKRITATNGQLVVRSARIEDAGKYTCILINSYGSAENSSLVIVQGMTTFSSHRSLSKFYCHRFCQKTSGPLAPNRYKLFCREIFCDVGFWSFKPLDYF